MGTDSETEFLRSHLAGDGDRRAPRLERWCARQEWLGGGLLVDSSPERRAPDAVQTLTIIEDRAAEALNYTSGVEVMSISEVKVKMNVFIDIGTYLLARLGRRGR